MKRYKLKITTCSPLHIGGATDFEPTNYVISDIDNENAQSLPEYIICEECGYKNPYEEVKETGVCGRCESDLEMPKITKSQTKQYFLYTFTPTQLAASSLDRRALLETAESSDNILALQKFFKDNIAKIVQNANKRAVVTPSIAKVYEQKFGNLGTRKNDRNQFIIEKNISTGVDDTAYIPASSLKGAIRTAVLSHINKSEKLDKNSFDDKKSIEYEKRLLNYSDASDDPFYQLKISDALPCSKFKTKIVTAKNMKRDFEREAALSVKMEVMPSGLDFAGELNFSARNSSSANFDIDLIRTACNNFYLSRLESAKYKMMKIYHIPASFFAMLENYAQEKNTFIVCLGKHGGAENVTIDGIRNIKINQGKGKNAKYQDHATTYWFADDDKQLMPFGWCVIKFAEE